MADPLYTVTYCTEHISKESAETAGVMILSLGCSRKALNNGTFSMAKDTQPPTGLCQFLIMTVELQSLTASWICHPQLIYFLAHSSP